MKIFTHSGAAERRPRGAALYVILSLFIPALVLTLALIALGVAPFGKHTLAISDGCYYVNGFMHFKRLLQGQENLLYSFKNGLGGNEWSLLAWGGFSFGGLLSPAGTLENMPDVFTWICVLNMSLCGLTMYLLLAYLNGHRLSNLIFSTSYALMGFNVVNCFQALFFIGPQMLPLVALGLVMLVRGKSPLVYILSLALCIFINFYFGFHLCVYSGLFFLASLYVRADALRGRRAGRFGVWAASSVIAGLLAAPMWLPALKAYSGGGRLEQTALEEFAFRENMPFIQIFSKLFTGANSQSEMVTGLPNIFCGIVAVALAALYFMDRGIELRRRRAAGAALAAYLLTFYITAFTLAMHGGTHTNWFPYRYSYVFSFLLIGLAAEEFRRVDGIALADAKRCGAILLGATVLVFSTRYEFVNGGDVLLDWALLLLAWVGFWLYKTRPTRAPMRVLSLFLMLVVCGNLYANFIISIRVVREWELDLEDYAKRTFSSGALADAVRLSEDGFYRMEKDVSESGSVGADPLLYGYNGVSHSGPGERMFIHKGLCKLGVHWYDMRHWYEKGVPAATDALLGVKYLIAPRDLTEEKGYDRKVDIEENALFQNENALGVAILADAAAAELELGENVFQNLNAVWSAMTGDDRPIFTEQPDVTYSLHNAVRELSVTSAELRESASAASQAEPAGDDAPTAAYMEYSFTAAQDGPVYVFDTSIPGSVNGLAAPALRYVGTFRAGDAVKDRFNIYGTEAGTEDLLRGYCVNQVFAYADDALLAEYAEKLNAREITFEAAREDRPTGTFTAEAGQRLLFTIPWDEGWSCRIDGEEVPIDKTWDLFMSVEAPEGSHTYELRFFPAWLNCGLCLCAGAAVALAVFMAAWALGRRREERRAAAAPEESAAAPGESEAAV